jgi:hypothetical protein
MRQTRIFDGARHHYDPVARTLGGAALCVALAALVFAMTGLSNAKPQASANGAAAHAAIEIAGGGSGGDADGETTRRTRRRAAKRSKRSKRAVTLPPISGKPRPGALLRLDKHGKFPLSALPAIVRARTAQRLGGRTPEQFELNCPHVDDVDLGTWCMSSSVYPLPPEELGKNNFVYAAKACVDMGGWLPDAAQLIGAAAHVKLNSTIDDNATSASVDQDATDGLKDKREMSGSLFTTDTGGSAAGSEGPSVGSKGNPNTAEPNPIPLPSNPLPDTLDYVTVYDNHDIGGFAGGLPVGQTADFRCAYAKTQGPSKGES